MRQAVHDISIETGLYIELNALAARAADGSGI